MCIVQSTPYKYSKMESTWIHHPEMSDTEVTLSPAPVTVTDIYNNNPLQQK